MDNLTVELQILTTLTGLVMEEVAAMEIILTVTAMELLIIQMVEPLEMVKLIKTKITIMSIKMDHINQELAVFLVMFQSSKIHSIKLNNTMEILVKNTDKVRYGIYLHSYF